MDARQCSQIVTKYAKDEKFLETMPAIKSTLWLHKWALTLWKQTEDEGRKVYSLGEKAINQAINIISCIDKERTQAPETQYQEPFKLLEGYFKYWCGSTEKGISKKDDHFRVIADAMVDLFITHRPGLDIWYLRSRDLKFELQRMTQERITTLRESGLSALEDEVGFLERLLGTTLSYDSQDSEESSDNDLRSYISLHHPSVRSVILDHPSLTQPVWGSLDPTNNYVQTNTGSHHPASVPSEGDPQYPGTFHWTDYSQSGDDTHWRMHHG